MRGHKMYSTHACPIPFHQFLNRFHLSDYISCLFELFFLEFFHVLRDYFLSHFFKNDNQSVKFDLNRQSLSCLEMCHKKYVKYQGMFLKNNKNKAKCHTCPPDCHSCPIVICCHNSQIL